MSHYIDAIEHFVIAHEYSHLLDAEAKAPVGAAAFPSKSASHAQELAADASGILLAMEGTKLGSPTFLLGPVAFFKCLSLFEQAGVVALPKDHPPSVDRMCLIKLVSAQALNNVSARKHLCGLASHVESSIQAAWDLAVDAELLKPTAEDCTHNSDDNHE